MATNTRILVKLRAGTGLSAAPRANLRALYDTPTAPSALGLAPKATWFLADLPDGEPNPWDSAHRQVADQLGVDESSVLFAEPDLAHTIYDPSAGVGGIGFAAALDCTAKDQSDAGGRVKGDRIAWHLGDDFSQLGSARDEVSFAAPRTRIAHIDTGYDRHHSARPANILKNLERNFVDGDDDPTSAQDPNHDGVFDNSGHGTGTIGILAGRESAALDNMRLGGAPDADVLPLRIANRVILFHTSAFAQALQYAVQRSCDVVSISMGGLPSRAWNEAVNDAYEAGVCIVAAAGNNMAGVPTRHVVYPARYRRTIAACGVMFNQQAYDGLSSTVLEGNFGPASCMTAAIAAYTPNIPWPVFGCDTTIRFNGEGTSAATPQVAAAVALWFEKYKSVLQPDWHRVEAVRHALFTAAKAGDAERFGNGTLRAKAALDIGPVLTLEKTPPDSDSFAFLRVLTGLGITTTPPRETMFNIEIMQRWLLDPNLQKIVPDPESQHRVSKDTLREFMEALIEDQGASRTLKKHIVARYPLAAGKSLRKSLKTLPSEDEGPERPACNPDRTISIPVPTCRRLRVYGIDPTLSTRLDTASINEVTLKVRWEADLKPGPMGDYLQVADKDACGHNYLPKLDLNDPLLLAQDGWAPAEGNAAFHQQMVYAVAMKTIEHFEQALGRPVLWRPRINPANDNDDRHFERHLILKPHALREANAYYSPQEIALLFGYFEASPNDPGDHVPGSMVYTCLSHDIVAHETTHAILDGMHRRFNEASNPDVLAMHEAFADIVALMQHFTIPQILQNEITRTRGDLEVESALGSLAVQFGHAMGGRGALRDAIGKVDSKGVWTRLTPDPTEYRKVLTPHARGALLVAAVFDAFLAIYKRRTADLLRIYTGGTGVLPNGAIHPDLVARLAEEAAKSAQHVLNMCIRALDYIPPVDINFGDYLRGLITADFDLVGDDPHNYRVAFVEAFRRRGIYPHDLETLSVDTLRWDSADFLTPPKHYETVIEDLKRYADACFYIDDRKELFDVTRDRRHTLHATLKKVFDATPKFAKDLWINPKRGFEVHELRRSIRVRPDGRYVPQIIVALTQQVPLRVDASREPQTFRGGATLIVDLSKPAVTYRIVKNIDSKTRQDRTKEFLNAALGDPLRELLLAQHREPFAILHSIADVGGFSS